jgi:hypothetical protein
LREAARLDPDGPRFAYVLSVTLNSFGKGDEASDVLDAARQQCSTDFEIPPSLIS